MGEDVEICKKEVIDMKNTTVKLAGETNKMVA